MREGGRVRRGRRDLGTFKMYETSFKKLEDQIFMKFPGTLHPVMLKHFLLFPDFSSFSPSSFSPFLSLSSILFSLRTCYFFSLAEFFLSFFPSELVISLYLLSTRVFFPSNEIHLPGKIHSLLEVVSM